MNDNNIILVQYKNKPYYQKLHPSYGPYMVPLNNQSTIYLSNNKIVYPTTHSIPGPYLQSYISLPNRKYMY